MKEKCLTPTEKDEFLKKGYLVIPDALSQDQTQALVSAIDRLSTEYPKNRILNIADIFWRDDAFLDLLDCPTVFPKIWGLLGWNIWVNHSHFNVNPSIPDDPAKSRGKFVYAWHRDSGVIYQDLQATPPPVCIKIGFYLTDVSETGGATLMVDGSESSPIPDQFQPVAGAKPLALKAGSAVIFDNRIIHSARSPNQSHATRKAIFIQYAYRWMQSLTRNNVERFRGKVSDVRMQLLGLTTTYTNSIDNHGRSGCYYPTDHDVPLRKYINDLLGDNADQFVGRPTDDAEVWPWKVDRV